jgi:hypothetical protein
MKANLRVHISPVGFDPPGRVTGPLVEFRADKAYLLSKSKTDAAADRRKQVHQTLAKHPHIEVVDVYADIFDLFGCLEEYRRIFELEKGNHVHVNVSTGSKIVSIAGMIACMLWKGTPYYAKLDYEDSGPSVTNEKRKVTATYFLPVYQIIMPTTESLQVLSIISKAPGERITKKDLIDELQALKLMPAYQPSQTRSAPHSRLRAILDPLEKEWHFIEVRARGRKSEVALTEQGRAALRIFGAGGVHVKSSLQS